MEGEKEKRDALIQFQEVDMDTVDPNFKYEIASIPGGENILSCFQCGTCSVTCPVSAEDGRYDPRIIIRMALLGMRNEVLLSDSLWLCSGCYSCYERCPQDVKITSLIAAIQTIAMKEGYIHPSIKSSIKLLNKHGRMVEIDEFDNKMRIKFNLPEIEEKAEETQRILNRSEIKRFMEGD